MHKGTIIGTDTLKQILIAAMLCSLFTPMSVMANDCRYWQLQINKVKRWSNQDGADRDRQLRYLQDQMAKCSGTSQGSISVASGQKSYAPADTTDYTSISPMYSDTSDSELQQLIASCNRWINIQSNTPSMINQSTRDTACRAATNREALLKNPTKNSEINIKRSIKDCIKPNNVVDNDVKACMQGTKEPAWK